MELEVKVGKNHWDLDRSLEVIQMLLGAPGIGDIGDPQPFCLHKLEYSIKKLQRKESKYVLCKRRTRSRQQGK